MTIEVGAGALLFESREDEERLQITCEVTHEGDLVIRQVSDGDLTMWCYEESPHEVTVRVAAGELRPLAEYFHAEDAGQLVELLAAAYGDYDASMRIRGVMRRLGVAYQVDETPIAR